MTKCFYIGSSQVAVSNKKIICSNDMILTFIITVFFFNKYINDIIYL